MNKQHGWTQHGGFTLIELLVVVLIISILAAVALPQYNNAVTKARATEAILALKAIATAEKAYFLANEEYATDLNQLDIKYPQLNTHYWRPVNIYHENSPDDDYVISDFSISIVRKDWAVGFSYYLKTDEIACVVSSVADKPEEATSFCKLFASTSATCHSLDADDGNTCYYL